MKPSRALILACAAIAAGAAVSCSSTKPIASPDKPRTQAAAPVSASAAAMAADVAGDWQVVQLGHYAVDPTVADAPYIGFSPVEGMPSELNCYAFNGCNFLNVTIGLGNGGSVKTRGQGASTLKLCPDARYELDLASALAAMESMRTAVGPDGNTYLYLLNGSGKELLTLRRNPYNFLDGAWQAAEIAGGRVPADVKIQMVVDLANGKLHGNGGCNTINGRVSTTAEGGISFTDIASTRMSCPSLELERAFIGALESTATAISSDGGSRAQLRDASGHTLLTLRRLDRSDL